MHLESLTLCLDYKSTPRVCRRAQRARKVFLDCSGTKKHVFMMVHDVTTCAATRRSCCGHWRPTAMRPANLLHGDACLPQASGCPAPCPAARQVLAAVGPGDCVYFLASARRAMLLAGSQSARSSLPRHHILCCFVFHFLSFHS